MDLPGDRSLTIGDAIHYGGVRFVLASDVRLAEAYHPFCADSGLSFAECLVEVVEDEASFDLKSPAREIHFTWTEGRAAIHSHLLRGSIVEERPGHYRAAIQIRSIRDFGPLCTSIASALHVRHGGLILHATAISVESKAFLFIGPSGAGKTTAANLCKGAKWLARDRAAVFFHNNRPFVAAMAGGDEVALEFAGAQPCEVSAIFRVLHADVCAVSPVDTIRAIRILRESAQLPALDVAGETALLSHLASFAERVPLGWIQTKLGENPLPYLADFRAGK